MEQERHVLLRADDAASADEGVDEYPSERRRDVDARWRRLISLLLVGATLVLGIAGHFSLRRGRSLARATTGDSIARAAIFEESAEKRALVARNIVYALGAAGGKLNLSRCALVGSGGTLSGQGKGAEIDSHDTVIRVNRKPTSEFYGDVGKRIDVMVVNTFHQDDGRVVTMGGGESVGECNEDPACREAAIVVGPGFSDGCPIDTLLGAWGSSHSLVGCLTLEVKHLAWRFKWFRGAVSTGFLAFLAFAPICSSLDVYGFQGYSTNDGHVEWSEHPLEQEHTVEHRIAAKDWSRIWVVMDAGFSELLEYWDWFKQHVGQVTIVE